MKRVYEYLFLKLYLLMKKTPGKRTADDAALMLLLSALFLYTSPILFFILDYFFDNVDFSILIIVGLAYLYFLYKINKWYFIDKGELTLIVNRYQNETAAKSTMGFIAAITFELFGFIAFFLLLSFF